MHPEERRIYLALLTSGIIVVSVVVHVAISMLRSQRRKVLVYRLTLQQEMKIQEAERTRIAADLHDEINSALSVMKLRLSGLRLSQGKEEQTMQDMLLYLDKLSDRVRRVSNQLLPVVLEHQGLQTALEELIQPLTYSRQYKITSRFSFDDSIILPEAAIHIYRMFQEIVSNIVKYSQASEATFLVTETKNFLHLHVSDNGRGFDPKKKTEKGSLGLYNIRMRADLLQARLYLVSNQNEGTRYDVEIPKQTIVEKG